VKITIPANHYQWFVHQIGKLVEQERKLPDFADDPPPEGVDPATWATTYFLVTIQPVSVATAVEAGDTSLGR